MIATACVKGLASYHFDSLEDQGDQVCSFRFKFQLESRSARGTFEDVARSRGLLYLVCCSTIQLALAWHTLRKGRILS